MRILVACEESQEVCKAFRAKGHEAYSCDVLPCSGGHPEWHIMKDVCEVLDDNWDMILAFPPCTYLSNAGARHLWRGGVLNKDRYLLGMAAREFFMMFYNADCDRICIENPTPSRVYELPKHDQTIQPWQFGHPYTKRTNLWLKGLSPLIPTDIVKPERTWCPSSSYSREHSDVYLGVFTKDRPRQRSKTFSGIAAAMAAQWG